MNELQAGLQRLADRADETALPPPSVIRAAGDRRTRRIATAVAGVAIAAVIAAVGVVLTLPDSPRDDAPAPSDQSPSPTALPSGVTHVGDHYAIEPGWERTSPHAIASRGTRYVIVADSSVDGGSPVWWSDDGWTWTPASEAPQSVNITDVIATADGFLATGRDDSGATTFWSEDGDSWHPATMEVDQGSKPTQLWGINGTDHGYVAYGFIGRVPRLYWSADGRIWTSTDLAAEPGREKDTSVCWVEDSPTGGLVATGFVWARRDDPQDRVTWTSADGSTWTRSVDATASNMIVECNHLQAAHWEAVTDAGTVRVTPIADNRIYFTPAG